MIVTQILKNAFLQKTDKRENREQNVQIQQIFQVTYCQKLSDLHNSKTVQRFLQMLLFGS